MSRPRWSAPSRCSSLGRARTEVESVAIGSWVWSALAKRAANTMTSITTPPAAPRGFLRAKRSVTVQAPGRAGRAPATTSPASARATAGSGAIAHPRVEHPVEHVHREVGQHHDDGDEHHEVLDDRVVAPEDRLDQEACHPRQVEHGLGDNEAADQERELDADHGDDRQERVLEGVAPDDGAPRLPLAPARAD